jgi:hypothetical protein
MVAGRGGEWRLAVLGGYEGNAGRGTDANRTAPHLWLHHYTPAAADADSRSVDRIVRNNDGKRLAEEKKLFNELID